MTRIVLRHRGGSKRDQTEEFLSDQARDLLIGRDPSAQVRFDPRRDAEVGRQHARILQHPADPGRFSLVDLSSRNGTFLNGRRVVSAAELAHGDCVQLGLGGPEFVFEVMHAPASPAAGKGRGPLIALWAAIVLLATVCSSFAQGTVTVTVTKSGDPLPDAFVALQGSGSTTGAYAGITDENGQATIADVAAGNYDVRAQAPGTTVGTDAVTVGGGPASTSVNVISSGTVLTELGAYGSGNEGLRADARSGVFYLLNTRAIPSIYRTGDYGGHWRPVTLSNDDPASGLDGSSTMRYIATSGQPGEVAVAGGGRIWTSRDFGTTWRSLAAPNGVNLTGFSSPPNYYLHWAHGRDAGSASILFLVERQTTAIYWADATADDPVFVPMAGSSYKAAAADLVTVANGGDRAMFVVLNATTTTGRAAGSATFFAVDATPSNTDTPTTVEDVIPTAGTNSVPVTVADAFWIEVGGPATGVEVGGVRAPNTILVYSDDLATNTNSNATMTVCGSSPASCTSTSTTTFLDVDNTVDINGKFSGGPFGNNSSCGANRQANAVGSVAPTGSTGTVGSCWVTVQGSSLDVRSVANINNNTGMVYDAGYDGTTNFVLISNDGQHGAVKSARTTRVDLDDRVNPNNGTPWNDPGLDRPYFPRFPQIATAGTGIDTGGTAITGLNGAIIRQIVFAPGDPTKVAAVMDFNAGGRAIGSTDGGQTWFTLYDIGGAAIDWWNGATPGTQWILQGSAGQGNWLLGRRIDTFDSETQLRSVHNGSSQPLGPSDFGEVANIIGSAGLRAIKGIPGTDYAILASYDGQNHKFHVAKLTQNAGQPVAALTELTALTIPETADAQVTPLGNAGAVRMSYCSAASPAPWIQDLLAVAMGGTDYAQPGLLTVLVGIGAALEADPANPDFSGVGRNDLDSSADFRDIRINCVSGTAWLAAVVTQQDQALGRLGIAKSEGGNDFELITLPPNTPLQPFQQIVAIDFNKIAPRQVTAVSRNGDILRSDDDGETWTILNNSSTASCQNVVGPCGRAFGAEPGDIRMPPPTGGGATNGARTGKGPAVTDVTTPGILGSAAGMFSVAATSASSLSDRVMFIDAPTASGVLAAAEPFTVAGWAADRNVGNGTGVNAVHVYAFPSAGGSPIFLGAASYGAARADIAVLLGAPQFTNSGFSLSAPGLPAGSYTIRAFARSVITNDFDYSTSVDVSVAAPDSDPLVFIDSPAPGDTVGQVFELSGWSADRGASTGTGMSIVQVWAYPIVDGAFGAPVFLGGATTGLSRPDVGSFLGDAQFDPSGFSLDVASTSLAAGTYRIVVFSLSTVSGTYHSQTVDVHVGSTPVMSLDIPSEGTVLSQSGSLTISGWAADLSAATGSGVDAVHIWYCAGANCATPTDFLTDAAVGDSRPDVATFLGSSQFANSGFSITGPLSEVPPGEYTLFVYARSTIGGFNQWRSVHVTVE